jgi:hypothetical protein
LHPRILLQLLHQALGKGSRSADQNGIFVSNIFVTDYFVTCESLCRVPEDISPDYKTKSAPIGSESPKVEKPLSSQDEKSMPESLKPPSPKGARGALDAHCASPYPTRSASSHDPVDTSKGLEPTESLETTPLSPRSYALEPTSGYDPGEDLSLP